MSDDERRLEHELAGLVRERWAAPLVNAGWDVLVRYQRQHEAVRVWVAISKGDALHLGPEVRVDLTGTRTKVLDDLLSALRDSLRTLLARYAPSRPRFRVGRVLR